MNRKALLISNPGEKTTDENYCRGVSADVKNYNNFLMSPLGGAWTESEITLLHRPSCERLDLYVSLLSFCDYSLILFTGHGYFHRDKDSTILILRNDEEYDSLNLLKNTTKRTVILDCCRKKYPERIQEKYAMDAMIKRFEQSLSLTNCRKYYDKRIELCSRGNVVCYSCRKDEESGDHGSNGGFYASSLIRAANIWFEHNDVDPPHNYDIFSIVAAHNNSINYVSKLSGDTQHPEISKSKSSPYFPFAVMAL